MTASVEAPPIAALDQATHTYRICGKVRPGVNELLAAAGIVTFDGIPEAALARGRDRGTAVHLATQYDDEGVLDLSTCSDYVLGCVKAWRWLQRQVHMECFLREAIVWSNVHGYAGTVDWCGLVNGKCYVLDIKSNVYLSAGPQLCAYQQAIREMVASRLLPPEVEPPVYRAIVKLLPNGRAQMKHQTDPDDWTVFMAARNIAAWKEKNG